MAFEGQNKKTCGCINLPDSPRTCIQAPLGTGEPDEPGEPDGLVENCLVRVNAQACIKSGAIGRP